MRSDPEVSHVVFGRSRLSGVRVRTRAGATFLVLWVSVACGRDAELEVRAEWNEEQPAPTSLSDTVLLSIGAESSGPTSSLYNVRGAQIASDGRVVVADANQIMTFESTGEFLGAVGREGEGPGEFRSITWMRVLDGDTIVLYDGLSTRLTWYSVDGDLVATLPMRNVVGLFDDGTMARLVPVQSAPLAGGQVIARGMMGLERVNREGQVINPLGSFPSNERLELPERNINFSLYRNGNHPTLAPGRATV